MTYHDKHGDEITDGSYIELPDGSVHLVSAVDDPQYPLGYDATRQSWIKSGRAYPGEYGFYPLTPDTARHSVLLCTDVPLF